jgi:hypothetical protein
MSDVTTKATIIELALSRFNQDVLPAEKNLFQSAEVGENADCSALSENDRIIRSDRLSWLCTDREATAHVTSRGVSIIDSEITGDVNLEWSKMSFPLRTRKCTVLGSIFLRNSRLDYLELAETSLKNLEASGLVVDRSILLNEGFVAEGQVNLQRAKIGGDLDCRAGHFGNEGSADGPALNAAGAEVAGYVFLTHGFSAKGEVRFVSAKVGGNLDCTGGHFQSKCNAPALNANGAKIGEFVFLRNDPKKCTEFRASGEVRLRNAVIGQNVECDGGEFTSIRCEQANKAIDAVNVRVKGAVFLRAEIKAEGEVDFSHANIGQLFSISDVRSKETLDLDLRFARAGTLANFMSGWPGKGHLQLDGFVYESIRDVASPEAEVQLSWLRLQSADRFFSQPFEQLAIALRRRGLVSDARTVMIEKNKDYAKHVDWRSAEWWWYGFLGRVIDYGYRPWKALLWSAAAIGIGWLVFELGYEANLIVPTGIKAYRFAKDDIPLVTDKGKPKLSKSYPKFNAFIYSVETFVPLLKLQVNQYWVPNGAEVFQVKVDVVKQKLGLFRLYFCFHTIAGWILTTLWIGGLTGLVKT